jgi:TetR/AcrR family transcriptional regulator, lmrAB and yxaGH operons repressor
LQLDRPVYRIAIMANLTETAPVETRLRLIRAMQYFLATRGFHGIGLTELLNKANAPKGVMYHHFPGGKTELALVAIEESTQAMLRQLDKALAKTGDASEAITMWFEGSIKLLSQDNFEMGCPLATVALESTSEDIELRHAIAKSFAQVRDAISRIFEKQTSPVNAKQLAALFVAAYEGALMQARVAQSAKPLRDTLTALLPLIQK